MSITESDGRGIREVCRVAEDRKWNSEVELETGVPRVEALLSQRVSKGRIHASAATVAVVFCVTDAQTTTKQEEKEEKNQKTTKTEKKVPNTKMKQKRQPWKRKY